MYPSQSAELCIAVREQPWKTEMKAPSKGNGLTLFSWKKCDLVALLLAYWQIHHFSLLKLHPFHTEGKLHLNWTFFQEVVQWLIYNCQKPNQLNCLSMSFSFPVLRVCMKLFCLYIRLLFGQTLNAKFSGLHATVFLDHFYSADKPSITNV